MGLPRLIGRTAAVPSGPTWAKAVSGQMSNVQCPMSNVAGRIAAERAF